MARGLNKVMLIGNLGADPEVRAMPSGIYVANFNIATTGARKDPQTDQWVEETEWHKVVLYGKTAEIAQQYLRKGSQVYIEGRLRTRKWQDQNGNDRWTTEVIGNEMQMLGSRSGGGMGDQDYGGGYGGGGGYSAPPPAAPMSGGGRSGGGNPANQQPPGAPPIMNDFDDDIPF